MKQDIISHIKSESKYANIDLALLLRIKAWSAGARLQFIKDCTCLCELGETTNKSMCVLAATLTNIMVTF